MAACGSLQHIFEKPLPENPTLFETLSSWNQKNIMKPIHDSSFTELFGELHFKENNNNSNNQHHHSGHDSFTSLSPSPSSSFSDAITNSHQSASWIEMLNNNKDKNNEINEGNKSPSSSSSAPACFYPSCSSQSQRRKYRHSDSFSSMNSESLSICTEGLGFESSDDVEELILSEHSNSSTDWQQQPEEEEEKKSAITRDNGQCEYMYCEHKRLSSRGSNSNKKRGSFPPPISCIGRNGKPWVCFKSYRQDGRFILQEIRVPTQEFLHACREDGRLTLQFVLSDDEFIDDDDDDLLEDIAEADEGKEEEDSAAATDDDEELEKKADVEEEDPQNH